MPPSINDLIYERALSHAVDLQQYSNQVVKRIMAVLNRSDARLFSELTQALERLDPSSFTVERLESLLYSVRSVNRDAYATAGNELRDELKAFVEYESAYQRQALVSLLPVQVHVAAIDAGALAAAALSRPFQGVLLRDVWSDLDATKMKKVRQSLAQGFAESKTTDQIIRELRGTRAKGFADGLLEVTRRDAEAVVRTALGHFAGYTQDKFVEANTDLIAATVWQSTIDLRVSTICLIRDGKRYTPDTHKPIGHSIPWLGGPGRAHWRCRSHQTYILFSHKELGIDAPEVILRDGTRASLDGQIPKDVKLPEWVKDQSAARQDELFGPTRGALLRSGGLKVEDLYSFKGQFLDLKTLRERDAKAFAKAGL